MRGPTRQQAAAAALTGVSTIAAGLAGLGGYHYLTFGGDPLRVGLVVATGLLLFLGVGYLLGGNVSPATYPVAFGWTLLGTLIGGGGTVGVTVATGSIPTLAGDAPTLGALAGGGAVAGFLVGVKSARARQAATRAARAETAIDRLSEERGRFVVLNETTRSLLDAPDIEAVASRLVEEGRVGLPGPFAGVWLHEPERDRLVPAETTSTDADWTPQQLWPDSEAMAAFEHGDPLTITGDEFPDVGPLFAVPIGDHGLLVVGATQGFDERARNLAGVYALTAAAAMDRIEREAKLERQNERLDSFASVVAHDLRNPLNVVRGRAKLAEKTGDTEQLEPAFRSLDRMETIIEDVLALARGGDEDIETEPVKLTDHVEASWHQVDTRDAELEVGFLPTAHADPDRLARLFENLFRNAVEHGGDDVVVSVAMLDDDDGFYVADDGIGIPVDERDRILSEGFSGNDGTGIGLAIVQQVAEVHGWDLSVTESESGGARFEFRF
ncbi:sensor histidine kinase [Halorarius litoreus]|uniref:sensor histidine kinase n=1 Tax=Halorarius litoreus TaxID=2962676 RepID=UPI0020CDA749|nr:GAF domain-containing sensor histidine kinase [Halorarius litoreus]